MNGSAQQHTWDGSGTQEEFMKRDECILVDEGDEIVGHSSKYQAHRFEGEQPRGLLHRAFSVFLFDQDDRLLLQQRAGSKITFPHVWTNTCCSHPLYGYEPTEVDTKEDVCNGSAPGAAQAAIRKLEHELGISPETFSSSEDFKFLTRLHYCARDEKTWGPDAPWGEHEMDYILFAKVPNVVLNPNADEVQATAYVTRAELKEMMEPNNGLLWSPWFRIIAETFLEEWWDDLEATLTTNKHVDAKTIHSILKE
ncbi:Isopentenyl-diphosphate Delta-isomerase II [Picochlorum sp. SENEW3]|nr:Isopentenyl-diphosphate Delta-isomerase II [Picochlorum sp. SENEW3]